jgi:hypothetical protein
LVRFFPNIVGLHRRASLASSRIECVESSRSGSLRDVSQFSQGTVAKRARRKDVKSNKGIVLAFQRAILFIFVRYRTPKTGTLEHPPRQTIIRFPWNEECCPGLSLSAFHVGRGIG